jgi:hypothetical protein
MFDFIPEKLKNAMYEAGVTGAVAGGLAVAGFDNTLAGLVRVNGVSPNVRRALFYFSVVFAAGTGVGVYEIMVNGNGGVGK